MSALHCPATLVLAHVGAPDEAGPDLGGDEGGWLSPADVDRVNALVGSLVDRRVAAVYALALGRVAESARIAGAILGVRASVHDGLQDVGRYREALQGIADQHRGETVLVCCRGGVMPVVHRLTGAEAAEVAARGDVAVVEVTVDGDGFG